MIDEMQLLEHMREEVPLIPVTYEDERQMLGRLLATERRAAPRRRRRLKVTAAWATCAAAAGVAAFVLIYRLGPKYHHPIELGDAQRAIRMVRARAKEFNVLPDRIGIIGFSAGGHLASTAETHFDGGNPGADDPVDRVSSRPDFAILGYGVVSFMKPELRGSSAKALIGENADPQQLEELSNELHVTAQTPPTFLFSTSEDKSVPSENSLLFYGALHKAGVPAELHIFEKGPHGVGLDLGDPFLGEWPKLLANWLRSRGLLARPTA